MDSYSVEGRRAMFNDGSVRPADHLLGTSKEVFLPMRDGVKLRTLIFLPEGDGPWPTSLTRTCYPDGGADKSYAAFPDYEATETFTGQEYAKRGIAYVVQFCRGKNGSEGMFVPNIYDRNDGIDTLNWLADQQWVKNIGIQGESYMGFTTWIIADSLPAKVKALCCVHYGIDRHVSLYKNGTFRHDIMTGWAMANAGASITADYITSCKYRPQIQVDEDLWGVRLDWYRDWITNIDANAPYWQGGVWGILKNIPQKVNVPVLIYAGYFDHHMDGTLLSYERLRPEIKKQSRLVFGSWDHSHEPVATMHDPVNISRNIIAEIFEWFDNILVKEETPEGRIDAYCIGDDQWVKPSGWPILTGEKRCFYLGASQDEERKPYLLDVNRQDFTTVIHYDYDPDDPVLSIGGETIYTTVEQRGTRLQPPPCYRSDVVTFMTGPLLEDLRIAGNVNVKLYVSTDAEDTAFTAKLCEVLPNGDTYNIRSSIMTLAYRDKHEREDYVPDSTVEINIEMSPILWNIKKGSKVRLDISSSNFPEYSIHTNYPGGWALQSAAKIAHQKLHCGGPYVSSVEIPVLNTGRP